MSEVWVSSEQHEPTDHAPEHGERMTADEFDLLQTRMLETARDRDPHDSEWVRVEDTAGGPDRWMNASMYFAVMDELRRRRFASV